MPDVWFEADPRWRIELVGPLLGPIHLGVLGFLGVAEATEVEPVDQAEGSEDGRATQPPA